MNEHGIGYFKLAHILAADSGSAIFLLTEGSLLAETRTHWGSTGSFVFGV